MGVYLASPFITVVLMSNKSVQQMVFDRLTHTGASVPSFLHPVSVRLPPDVINQLDVLAEYLGYTGRSHLLRDLVESSLEDLIVETTKALADDPMVSSNFRQRLHSALGA